MAMFSQSNATMAPPQKPETFMLSDAAQQSLPQDSQVALQQVDNRKYNIGSVAKTPCTRSALKRPSSNSTCEINDCVEPNANLALVKYFLISAPVDWTPDQYIRRFLLPTGEYVSCVLW